MLHVLRRQWRLAVVVVVVVVVVAAAVGACLPNEQPALPTNPVERPNCTEGPVESRANERMPRVVAVAGQGIRSPSRTEEASC
jgi:hypothetical protein